MKNPDPRKTISLSNVACVYCGRYFGSDLRSTKDHVIARRLVPDGMISRGWNLIVKACEVCNRSKSDLESEVAAVTMQPDAIGRFARDAAELKATAARKGDGARSSVTGLRVAKSGTHVQFEVPLGSAASLKFSFVGPPQLNDDVALRLACHQIISIFYFLTFDRKLRLGRYWPGVFSVANIAHRADWGNPTALEFQKRTAIWDLWFCGVAAHGFFKAMVRKLPGPEPVWGWALEWNENYRLVGFFGDDSQVREQLGSLPQLSWQASAVNDAGRVNSRVETALHADHDHLFVVGDQLGAP